MTLLRTFPRLAFTLVLIGLAGFCLARGDVGLLVVAGVIAVVSWYLSEGPRGFGLPRPLANALVLLAAIGVFFDLGANPGDVTGVLGRFALWLALIRLYERKTHREWAQLLALSAVLMLAGALETRSFLFGLTLLIYVALGTYTLILFQLYRTHERARAARKRATPPGARLVPPLRPAFGRRAAGQFAALATATGLLGLAASVFVFLAYPRNVGVGLFRRVGGTDAPGGLAAPRDVSLLTGTRITDSPRRVMTLRLRDERGRAIRPDEPIYLRGTVLDVYDAERVRWTTSDPVRRPRVTVELDVGAPGWAGFDRSGFVPLDPGVAPPERAWVQEITPLLPLVGPMYAADLPVAVASESIDAVVWNPAARVIHPAGEDRLRPYRVVSVPEPDASLRADLTIPGAPPRARFYRDPTVRALAEEVLAGAGVVPPETLDAEALARHRRRAARAIEAFFHGDFTYTLDLRDVALAPGEDPIVAFLTEFRRGHCEHFASAMTAMLQALGIEARLVIGYVAWEFDEASERYVLRESSAHAWVEVRTSARRWERFDPTPPREIQTAPAPPEDVAGRMRSFYELLESRWLDRVVAYDRGSQARLRDRLNFEPPAWLVDAVEAADAWFARFVRRFGAIGRFWIFTVSSAAFVALLVIVQYVRRRRRIRRVLHLEHLPSDASRRLRAQLGFYLDMLDLLRRRGWAKPAWQPPAEFAAAVAREAPEAGAVVRDVVARFYRARFGGEDLPSEERREIERVLERLETLLPSRR